jgi:hypothetical protein
MKIYRKFVQVLLLVGAAAAVGCYPSPDVGVEEFDTVVTVVKEGADFGGLSTYFLPDSVFYRPGDDNITRAFDDLILSDIHRNMQQLGYSFEPDPQTNPPDLLVVASVITRAEYTAYLGWPFFGQSLTGQIVYPGVGMTYVYTLGTVAIDVARVADAGSGEENYPVMWTASISGPLQESRHNKGYRITKGIDQAFAQSPYLKPD